MIARLRGMLVASGSGVVVVDVGGVGYEVSVGGITQHNLPAVGSELELHIHTHVKEDILQLFGFPTTREREVFRTLLGVSNVGPRLALSVLSGLSVDDLVSAVAAKDLARLASVPGVGKKTAERLAFELQDKFTWDQVHASAPAAAPAGARSDLISALLNLGYKPAQADKAARAVGTQLAEGVPFEDVLREALRLLSRPS